MSARGPIGAKSANREPKVALSLMLAACTLMALSGCSSLGKSIKGFISGDAEQQAKANGPTRFSDNDNVRSGSDRQYKRMNRQKFEEESELKEDAGSLWVMEGQGAYLFSQNQIRMVGDLLNVKIDGSPRAQLQTKVKVISRLLERLENPGRGLASQNPGAPGAPGQPPAAANPAAAGPNGQAPQANAAAAAGAAGDAAGAPTGPDGAKSQEAPFAVQTVPTRIVEQLKDGSYRVRGMQPFMIGKREYKVIVTGVVRPEDFDDAGIDAGKLLDPQFDIVSSKKGAAM